MSQPKQKPNNMLFHGIIIVISLLSGLGIWTAVSPGYSSASMLDSALASSTPGHNSSFDTEDTFLTQPVQSRTTPRLRTRGS